ncbi:MAG: TolC family protein, partial [Candidatus Cloacimonadaceae bacterium]|jgi:outer membrane protein TolC|nr:TolC family protein [Candidatus Cloacimonadaceae bacterium]
MRTFSLNLSQPLFLGGKLYQSYKIASTSQEIADLSQEAKRFELLSGVESRFYSLLQLQELLNIGRAELERARNNLDLAEIKLLNGLIARADKLRFQANLANKEIALMQSKTAFDLALRDFANFLGSEELLVPTAPATNATQILPFAELSEADTEQFLSALRTLGKRDNLQLKVIGKSLELSERAYKIAKGSFLPSLNLVGSRSWEENGIDRYQFEASNQIMLNLSVPLLPQAGNYAAMRKAFFDAQQASIEARQASEGIVLGLEAAAMKMLSSARQVNAAKLSLELTQDMYDQLEERYRLNMISTIELMDAELMLSAAKMGYTNAYYDFFKARLDLLSMLGTDDLGILTALLEK